MDATESRKAPHWCKNIVNKTQDLRKLENIRIILKLSGEKAYCPDSLLKTKFWQKQLKNSQKQILKVVQLYWIYYRKKEKEEATNLVLDSN